jgi:tetratricopeptide (TPR) repeat protein
MLGLHPGPDIGIAATASLAGRDKQWAAARLHELAHAHLIREHEPGRFTMHDLLRAYAIARSETDDQESQRVAAVQRVLDYYLHSAYAAALMIYPHRTALLLPPAQPGVVHLEFADRESAHAWFAADHPVLLAAVERAAHTGLSRYAWQLASALSTFLSRSGRWHDWVSAQRLAVAVTSRLDDGPGEAQARCGLGQAYNQLGDYEQAHLNLRRSLDLFKQFDDSNSQAHIHLLINTVYEKQADYLNALPHAEAALDLYRLAGHRWGQARSSNSVGWFYAQLGRYDEAVAHCERAVALHREVGDRQGIAQALDSLGFVRHQLGQYPQAAADYRLAITELQAAGSLYHQTIPLMHLGEALDAAGQAGSARRAWLQALDILERLDHPDTDKVRERLSRLEHVR